MYSISLLSDKNLIETPFIKVDIGGYTFGVFQRSKIGGSSFRITYPNFVKTLEVKKINGAVNQYTLGIEYPVTAESDPNFFEKVFSSVSDTRKIIFSYGDFSTPNYIYANEEALITDVNSQVNISNASISYTVKAVSSAALTMGGSFTFPKQRAKPSTVIREMLYTQKYGLTDIFTGMQNKTTVSSKGLIATDDAIVDLEYRYESPLDHLNYLVSCMKPSADTFSGSTNSTVYTLTINDDREGIFGGPYFKIQKLQRNANSLESTATYTIDIGYPSADMVTDFRIENQQGYSILYDYTGSIDSYNYGKRIDDNGKMSYVPANPLTSSKQLHLLTEADKNWWTKVTEFPIKVSLTIKGLLRPTILMNYVKLNIWFYGRKHISSGYYIITAQTDRIDESNGFKTTLVLTRIAPDGDIDVAVGMFGEKINNSELNISTSTKEVVKNPNFTESAAQDGATSKFSTLGNFKLEKLPATQVHTSTLTGRKIIIKIDDDQIKVGDDNNNAGFESSGGYGSGGGTRNNSTKG